MCLLYGHHIVVKSLGTSQGKTSKTIESMRALEFTSMLLLILG